jgi:hypothetical protein
MTPKRSLLLALGLGTMVTAGAFVHHAVRLAKQKEAIIILSQQNHAHCVDRSEELPDDAVTPLGKVADLLRAAQADYASPLFWNARRDMAEYAAMGTRSRLRLSLRRQGPVRLVRSAPYYPKDGPATGALICSERIEVDVRAHAATDDGVLNEVFGPSLTLRDDGSIGFTAELPLESLAGSFAITEIHRDGLFADHLELNLRFSGQSKVEGYVGGAYPVSDGSSGTFTTLVRFACLPEQACP